MRGKIMDYWTYTIGDLSVRADFISLIYCFRWAADGVLLEAVTKDTLWQSMADSIHSFKQDIKTLSNHEAVPGMADPLEPVFAHLRLNHQWLHANT